MEKQVVSIKEASNILGISISSLRRYEDEESLGIKSIRTPGGHRRYRKSDLELLLKQWEGDKGAD